MACSCTALRSPGSTNFDGSILPRHTSVAADSAALPSWLTLNSSDLVQLVNFREFISPYRRLCAGCASTILGWTAHSRSTTCPPSSPLWLVRVPIGAAFSHSSVRQRGVVDVLALVARLLIAGHLSHPSRCRPQLLWAARRVP